MEKPVLLHVHQGRTSFVAKDARLLSDAFDVRDRPSVWKRKSQLPFLLLVQTIQLLFDRSWSAVVVQFAGHHAVIPALIARLRHKPCFIITGGTDCVSFPSLQYGHFAKEPLATMTRISFRLCSHILPVHASLMRSKNIFQRNDPIDQGVLSFMPDLRKPVEEIANGFDQNQWPLSNGVERTVDVLTVTSNDRRPSTLNLKGVTFLLEIARRRPELRFCVIGISGAPIANVPDNFEILPPVANHELPNQYALAKVYAQMSLSEGFPNALCEAMLCGCTPMVSAVAAMPMIVGPVGVVVADQNIEKATAQLDVALARAANGPDTEARARIASHFTESMRQEKLIHTIRTALAER
ncbi:MAG: glycosyltransferase family 4 protein [Flavobacteriales bacterium]|nr:glycosyltransferase family 4 protein [Flavobacteriales bacterium]